MPIAQTDVETRVDDGLCEMRGDVISVPKRPDSTIAIDSVATVNDDDVSKV